MNQNGQKPTTLMTSLTKPETQNQNFFHCGLENFRREDVRLVLHWYHIDRTSMVFNSSYTIVPFRI